MTSPYVRCTSLLLAIAASVSAADLDLSGPWKMKDFTRGMGLAKKVHQPATPKKDFLAVTVPTNDRLGLLRAGEIPDPYVGTNNEHALWCEGKEWWFVKDFTAAADLKGKRVDLVFEGIVYKGEVWLNGVRLGGMEGMFNPFAFDVAKHLKFGQPNQIAVRLEAPDDAEAMVLKHGVHWDLPDRPQLKTICMSQYCWDWAPHTVVTGIWRPVKLRVTEDLRLDKPWVRTKLRPEGGATLDISVEAENLGEQAVEATVTGVVKPKNFQGAAVPVHQTVKLDAKGRATAAFHVEMKDARLWWPNGMGEQNLYTFEAQVRFKDKVSDAARTSFGIRELKIVDNENADAFIKEVQTSLTQHAGQNNDLSAKANMGTGVGAYPWTFQVNGKKLFAKGGNWVPPDQLLRLERSRYDHLLTLAKDAHYNLFRVWGGGLFETDDFYELCDEKGILTWFEFLSNSGFSQIDQRIFGDASRAAIKRIRSYANLTFYCGGNEFDPDDKGSKGIIDGLDRLIKELDPDKEFHRASPYMGDDHYWGVWHRYGPYTDYRKVRPFRSEAGLNGPPVLESLKRFTPEDKLWPLDPVWVEYRGSYQLNLKHLPKQDRYANEYGKSTNLEQYLRHAHLAQSLADAFNIEFCRSAKFRNSGVLIWQYNDAYPCWSWSLVDWYGTPKPAYYYTKRANRPVHIAADFERYLWKTGETFSTTLSLLNDTYAPLENLQAEVQLLAVDGTVLARQTQPASVAANASRPVLTQTWAIPESFEGRSFFVVAKLRDAHGKVLSDVVYPIGVKNVDPPSYTPEQAKDRGFNKFTHYEGILAEVEKLPRIEAGFKVGKVTRDAKGLLNAEVTLSNPGKSLLLDTRLHVEGDAENLRASFDDNYLTLLPGESKTVRLTVKPDKAGTPCRLRLTGWNCPTTTIDLKP